MIALVTCVQAVSLVTAAGAQPADSVRPTVGVLPFRVAESAAPGTDPTVRAVADRLHHELVRALQQDPAVRWSEPHEDPQSAGIQGLPRLRRLIVDYLADGEVREVDGEYSCTVRVVSVEDGTERSVAVSFGAGEEARAAEELGRMAVEVIVGRS